MPVRKTFLLLVACAALLPKSAREFSPVELPTAATRQGALSRARSVDDQLTFNVGTSSNAPSRVRIFVREEGFGTIWKKCLYVSVSRPDGSSHEELICDPMERTSALPVSERSFATADLISFDAVKSSEDSLVIAASLSGGNGDLNWNDQPCGRNLQTGEQENGFRVLLAGKYRIAADGSGAFTELLTVTDLDESIYSECPCYGEWLPSGHVRLEVNDGSSDGFTLVEPAALHFDLTGGDCEEAAETREIRFEHSGSGHTLLSLEPKGLRAGMSRADARPTAF